MQVKTNELTEQELIHVLSLPDLSWQTCGPIIDRHNISVIRVYKDYPRPWLATHGEFIYMNADTPLIAAMRCLAAFKLGSEIEVPDELA